MLQMQHLFLMLNCNWVELQAHSLCIQMSDRSTCNKHSVGLCMQGGESKCGGRHRDVAFLDLALEGAARAALEGTMGAAHKVP